MISVSGLSYTYSAGSQPAVQDLSFAVEQGEIFGFLGPSGAGKSTTQKVLIKLLSEYQGSIHILGQDLREWGPDYYEQIGVSFEVPNHFQKLTARENLRYFGSLYKGPITAPDTLLAQVGLEEDADTPVAHFSKGMKNRLNVARSLLHDPQILFLDEPTAGLDPVNARKIQELIRQQRAAGKTILLTTHNMAVADALCDRVAFIVDGRITLIDSPRRLKLAHGRPVVQVEYGKNGHLDRQEFPMAGLGDNGPFLEMLRTGGVQTIHTQEATLDDIFVQVTGRRLL